MNRIVLPSLHVYSCHDGLHERAIYFPYLIFFLICTICAIAPKHVYEHMTTGMGNLESTRHIPAHVHITRSTMCVKLQYGEERILVEMPQSNSTVRTLLSAIKVKLPQCLIDGLLTWDGCEMEADDRYSTLFLCSVCEVLTMRMCMCWMLCTRTSECAHYSICLSTHAQPHSYMCILSMCEYTSMHAYTIAWRWHYKRCINFAWRAYTRTHLQSARLYMHYQTAHPHIHIKIMYTWMYIYTCVCVFMCICKHICESIHVYMLTHKHTHCSIRTSDRVIVLFHPT